MKPERGVLACRAILDRQVIHTRDTQAEPELLPSVRDLGIRSILAIPLLRDDNAVGAFAMNSEEPGGFTESQVALLQTFAEQAVIAITSAETYRALQTRTADLQESLEYQTATSDVLKVISRSTFDLQPVLDTVVETAARLCDAEQAVIARREGELVGWSQILGFRRNTRLHQSAWGISDRPDVAEPSRSEPLARVASCMFTTWPPFRAIRTIAIRLGKQRTSLGVPLLREGEGDRGHRARASAGRAIHRPADRTCQHLRRSGGDRDREHAADDRAARGAGTADRDGRGVAGDQRLARQSGAGVRCDAGKGAQAVRGGQGRYTLMTVSISERWPCAGAAPNSRELLTA